MNALTENLLRLGIRYGFGFVEWRAVRIALSFLQGVADVESPSLASGLDSILRELPGGEDFNEEKAARIEEEVLRGE